MLTFLLSFYIMFMRIWSRGVWKVLRPSYFYWQYIILTILTRIYFGWPFKDNGGKNYFSWAIPCHLTIIWWRSTISEKTENLLNYQVLHETTKSDFFHFYFQWYMRYEFSKLWFWAPVTLWVNFVAQTMPAIYACNGSHGWSEIVECKYCQKLKLFGTWITGVSQNLLIFPIFPTPFSILRVNIKL